MIKKDRIKELEYTTASNTKNLLKKPAKGGTPAKEKIRRVTVIAQNGLKRKKPDKEFKFLSKFKDRALRSESMKTKIEKIVML